MPGRPEAMRWWQRGIVYHIYPRSFQDNNGDGVGDLAGITSRLDYVQGLGVDAIWLSPIYPSPMADFGYDVSDYTAIDPRFGTLDDFDTLLGEAHRRGLKLLLDYVPNHSSDEHPWFQESRASRESPKRDWYIWRDPAPDGRPPNNWLSAMGGDPGSPTSLLAWRHMAGGSRRPGGLRDRWGGAWEWDERTGQFYLHTFHVKQPDLNWRNPEVRAAMLDVLRFWLDRGVDGFRVDALRGVIKDEQLRDNPPNPNYRLEEGPYHALLPVYSTDRPEVHEAVRQMRAVTDVYGDVPLIGEMYLPIERLVAYYGEAGSGLHLPTNFHLILQRWDARTIAAFVEAYEAALPGYAWPNWALGNHDRPRVASRIGAAQARMAALLLLTLRGTPTIYYGDEIGMRDVPIPAELAQDPVACNLPGLGLGRDPERTPMQWDASANAGFTSGVPWLPVADDYRSVSVAAEEADPTSMLALHRRLIALRRSEPALAAGAFAPEPAEGEVLAYLREGAGRRFLVALNFGAGPQRLETTALEGRKGQIVLSTGLDREGEAVGRALALRGDEGVVVAL